MRNELIELIRYDADYRDDLPAARYNSLINQAYLEACRLTDLPEEIRSTNVGAGQQRVPLPILKAYRAWWGDYALRREVPLRARMGVFGTPESFEQVGRDFVLYPTPNEAGTLLIEGVWEPALLENDNDTPILPATAHRAIVLLALAYYLDTLGADKRVSRAYYEAQARRQLEEVVRDMRVSRWGESRLDARYPVSFWLRGYE